MEARCFGLKYSNVRRLTFPLFDYCIQESTMYNKVLITRTNGWLGLAT